MFGYPLAPWLSEFAWGPSRRRPYWADHRQPTQV